MWHNNTCSFQNLLNSSLQAGDAFQFFDIACSAFVEFNCETTSVIDEESAELKIFDTANTVRYTNTEVGLCHE